MARVLVAAIMFGTVNSVVDGSILHFDPDGSDPRSREREVDERDLQNLRAAGLIAAEPERKTEKPQQRAPKVDEPSASSVGDASHADGEPSAGGSGVAGSDGASDGGDGTGISAADPDAPPVAPARGKPGPKPKGR